MPKKDSNHFYLEQSKPKNSYKTMVVPSLSTHNLSPNPIKFACGYGGRIVPRYPDGKLRYQGGENRVLSIDRSISFLELFVKMVEMCGTAVSLKCQLPNEDLDTLVSITSDEDLANIIEEYDRAAAAAAEEAETSLKIRAFLFGPKTKDKVSPPPSSTSSSNAATSPRSSFESVALPPRRSNSTSSSTGVTSPRSAFDSVALPPRRSNSTSSSTGATSPRSTYDSVALPPRRSNSASGGFIRQGERPPAYPVLNDKPAGKKVTGHQYAYGNCGHVCLIRNGNHWQ